MYKKSVGAVKPRRSPSVLLTTATFAALACTLPAHSAERPRSAMDAREATLSEIDRAELIDAAVKASAASDAGAGRNASATERAMMNMSREESRAMLSKPRVDSKSLSNQPVRIIKKGNVGMAVLGTALVSKSSVVITKDGKHLHSCGPEAHTHDPAVQEKIEAAARIVASLKGGVRE
jgi:hypothetical protein